MNSYFFFKKRTILLHLRECKSKICLKTPSKPTRYCKLHPLVFLLEIWCFRNIFFFFNAKQFENIGPQVASVWRECMICCIPFLLKYSLWWYVEPFSKLKIRWLLVLGARCEASDKLKARQKWLHCFHGFSKRILAIQTYSTLQNYLHIFWPED